MAVSYPSIKDIKDRVASIATSIFVPETLNEVVAAKQYPEPVTNTPMGIVYSGRGVTPEYEGDFSAWLTPRLFQFQVYLAPANSITIPAQVLQAMEDGLIDDVIDMFMGYPTLNNYKVDVEYASDTGVGFLTYNRKRYHGFEVEAQIAVRRVI